MRKFSNLYYELNLTEVYPQKVRIKGKLKTVRKFVLFNRPFPSRSYFFVYYKDSKPVVSGEICKTEIFAAMRKFAVEFSN